MSSFTDHLLGCANRGYSAFQAGKPCEAPYKFTPHAKGLYRQRREHWEGGWKEAQEHARTGPPPDNSPVTQAVPVSWREHEMMSVVGCIDSHGAITARACKNIDSHRPNESRGKRWRWLVWSQEFHDLAPRTVEEENNRIVMLHLNEEEHFAVCDWLIRNGYADDRILPLPTDHHDHR